MKISIKPARVGDGPNVYFFVRYEVEDGDLRLDGSARNERAALREIRRRVKRYRKAVDRLEAIRR